MTKQQKLDDFIAELELKFSTLKPKEYGVEHPHFILYEGNIDAKIMAVQMHPDRCEASWAINENTHTKYVCFGPAGNLLRRTIKRNKIPAEKVLYVNLVPFFPLGGTCFNKENIDNFRWILDRIIEIIEPKIMLSLGIDVFRAIIGDTDVQQFYKYIHTNTVLDYNGISIIPLENPAKVDGDNSRRDTHFFESFRRLATKMDAVDFDCRKEQINNELSKYYKK